MYIRTSKRPGEKRSRMITLISGGIAIIVIIFQLLIPHFIPALFTTVVRPFWRMEFSVMSGSLKSTGELLAENEALKIQLQKLTAGNSSVDLIRNENDELLSLLGRPSANSNLSQDLSILSSSTMATSTDVVLNLSNIINKSRLLGAVLVRPPFASYDEFIVDVGADHGVTVGSKVYAPGNILIGTISDVLGETSKVNLFSTPGQTYPVLIGATHVPASATGRGGGQYEAQIPQATQIAQGDIVSDASIGDGAFGTVTTVLDNPADPFETVLFSPGVNVYQLRWVLIDTGISTSNYIQINSPAKPATSSATTHTSTSSKAKR